MAVEVVRDDHSIKSSKIFDKCRKTFLYLVFYNEDRRDPKRIDSIAH